MPIYYKKVNPDTADLNLVESGLGSSTGSPGFFNFGSVPKKLANNFGGSRSSFPDNEVELERISCSFNVADEEEFDRSKLLSKTTTADRDQLVTKFGPITVVKQFPTGGEQPSAAPQQPPPPRPVIITYHDIGLNYFSNFESFFTRMNVKQMLQDFRIYHLNAPGQEENAEDLSSNYLFPTMDELAEQVLEVCRYYNIQEFIGFGYGAGGNVLSRVALANPDMVEALFLIHPSATTSTWTEWFYQKLNLRAMFQQQQQQQQQQTGSQGGQVGSVPGGTDLPPSVREYFIWHLFGNLSTPDRPIDNEAITFYRRYLESGTVNRHNLARFIESYIGRGALGIKREDRLNNFKCHVAVVCGDYSPHVDESVTMNARLDPTNSTWIKLSDCSMILEEQPNKLLEVMRLFLQGLGYTLKKALRGDRSFLTNKSMPCLAFYQRNQSVTSATDSAATISATSTSVRRATMAFDQV